MMKRLLMPLVLVFSATGFAEQSKTTPLEQNAPILISYAEFSHLTRAEQRTYIKKLREMMVKIAERDPKAAALIFEKYPMLQQFMMLTLPEAEAQTNRAASRTTKKPEPKLKDEDVWKKTKQYLKEAELYKKSIDEMTAKDLSAEDRNHLQERYQISLRWIGLAGSAANAMGEPMNKALLLKEVEQALSQADGQKATVLQKLPESERAAASAGFESIRNDFTKPAFENKIDFNNAPKSYVQAAVPLAKQVDLESKRPQVGLAEGNAPKPANPPAPVPPRVTAAPVPPPPPPPATIDAAPKQPKQEGLPGQSSGGKIDFSRVGIDGSSGKGSQAKGAEGSGNAKADAGKKRIQADGKNSKAGLSEGKGDAKAKGNGPGKAGGNEGNDGKDTDTSKGNAPASEASAGGPFRCMHSGFVIQGKRCMAPSSLPYDMSPLDKDTFKCERGKVMCNPLIFGFNSKGCNWVKSSEENKLDDCWKNAKPLCTFPGSLATVVCDEMSNTSDHIETAIDLFHANPAAWERYRSDFNSLCDAGNIDFAASKASAAAVRRDIEKTCAIARKQRDEILKRFGSKYWDELGPEKQKQLQELGVRPRKQPAAPAAPAAPPAGQNGGVR